MQKRQGKRLTAEELLSRFCYQSRAIAYLTSQNEELLIPFSTHRLQLVGLRVLGGIADAIAMPALLAITATLGKDRPGRFFGILRSGQGLSYVVAPALGSAFSLISLRAPFLVDGASSLLTFVAAFLLEWAPQGIVL